MGDDLNPDLLLARRVLEGLVLGTAALADPVSMDWAVSVLRTPAGVRTVIAGNMGDGGYLPASVYVPVGVHVAVNDRLLPIGWAEQYMGWKYPVDIVTAHAGLMSERTAGVTLSAVATTAAASARPDGPDYLVVSPKDILLSMAPAPVLDGGHWHRLVTLDQDLAQRISALARGTEQRQMLAWDITRAVADATQVSKAAGGADLLDSYDLAALQAVAGGHPVDWDQQLTHAQGRANGGLFFPGAAIRPRDLDDAAANVTMRRLYETLYRRGRIVELVRSWRDPAPDPADIAYCGIEAGHGAEVLALVTQWENRAR
ncbi:hypothetical protein AWC04_16705 [Mycolicibacterium fallax]|uniref:Uncharacterized protein n=2 Tax=Mycolicibacterium fallax TaxID=1793 RepID=A0A1X1R538_MYCFA|nr:hypothetical protein AWC04_16705 [Mycolicibacterium fallax]